MRVMVFVKASEESESGNGKVHDQPWLSRAMLQGGGILSYVMGARPNTAWGSAAASAPFSMSADE